MKVKKINEKDFEQFVSMHEYASMYQSREWKNVKEREKKKCELIGLYEENQLVGVSLIIYLPILKRFTFAYASRGIIYDYNEIKEFTKALKAYFKEKKVVFVRIDPPVILNEYDNKLNKTSKEKLTLIEELKKNGFIHFGFNMAAEAFQFRFVHRITLESTYEKTYELMSKSTKKNMQTAIEKGVKIKEVQKDELEEVLRLFQYTIDRKKIKGFPKHFYYDLLEEFKEAVRMYIVYIDKEEYIKKLKEKIQALEESLNALEEQMKKIHVGGKLTTKKEQLENTILKTKKELTEASNLEKITNIAAMLTITKYNEVVSLTSGMDNTYRAFCPKYVMYPEMIKDAYKDKVKYVNFLGVKNIFDENDKDHGVYEVKRGFGGKTIEYIGEFDLPIRSILYKIYKIKNKKR